MNKIKGVLVLALVFTMAFPCFACDVAIKRKKNKWISSMVIMNADASDIMFRPNHVNVV
jgi:hypothetical protein